ncbi:MULTISPECIES: hypothetical protein [Pasteurellaceae]|uniref:hypothetical protein n=1 Tax=Pasteurellaceae TaxID=712 RepID=UPI003568D899
MRNQHVDQFQFDLLNNEINRLGQIECLIHVLAKADFNSLEAGEIESSLHGINALLVERMNRLRDRVAFMTGGKND